MSDGLKAELRTAAFPSKAWERVDSRLFLLLELGVDHFLFRAAVLAVAGRGAARLRSLSAAFELLRHCLCGLFELFDRLIDGGSVVPFGLRFDLGHSRFDCRLRPSVEFVRMLFEQLLGL